MTYEQVMTAVKQRQGDVTVNLDMRQTHMKSEPVYYVCSIVSSETVERWKSGKLVWCI